MKVNNLIVISVGQAGVQIGASFWKSLCREHNIDPKTGQVVEGKQITGEWNAFFSRLGDSDDGQYVPRAIFVDSEPSVIDDVKKGCSLYNPGNFISSMDAAGSNFAIGYMGEASKLAEPALKRVEQEVSKCDHPSGIFIFHSLGGGTGSGLGAVIVKALREKYPEIPLMSCAILPSPQVSSVVTEPYNTVFALDTLRRYVDGCLIFDNEALFNLAQNKWGIDSPSVEDLNLLITEMLAGLTASMRFTGYLTVEISMRELVTNLVPQPGLHFLTTATSPLTPPEQAKFETPDVNDMIEELFANESTFAACRPLEGKFLSTAVLYRGKMEDKPKCDAKLAEMRGKLPLTSWIPTAFKIGYVDRPGVVHRKSMVLVANNTEIARVLERICGNFDKLWERKAFANWYLSEGMDESDISRMRESVGELIKQYRVAEESGKSASGSAVKPEPKAAPAPAPAQEPAPAADPEPEPEPEPAREEPVPEPPPTISLKPDPRPQDNPAPEPDEAAGDQAEVEGEEGDDLVEKTSRLRAFIEQRKSQG